MEVEVKKVERSVYGVFFFFAFLSRRPLSLSKALAPSTTTCPCQDCGPRAGSWTVSTVQGLDQRIGCTRIAGAAEGVWGVV
jgi:hypothetical protein